MHYSADLEKSQSVKKISEHLKILKNSWEALIGSISSLEFPIMSFERNVS